MSLTEETIQSEQVYDGDLLKVFRDDVRLPDGGSSLREWVTHPGPAAVVPFFNDAQQFSCGSFAIHLGDHSWNYPPESSMRMGRLPNPSPGENSRKRPGGRRRRWSISANRFRASVTPMR